MKGFEFHEEFRPCQEPSMAATIGAGIQDGELYDNLAKHNAIGVGGENLVRPYKPTLNIV